MSKININSKDAREKLIARLNCMAEILDAKDSQLDSLIEQREECCYPATNGLTNNGIYILSDGDIITLDTNIP